MKYFNLINMWKTKEKYWREGGESNLFLKAIMRNFQCLFKLEW